MSAREERPTFVPSAWPSIADLCPLVAVPRYPAPPNTDALETVRPPAGCVECLTMGSACRVHGFYRRAS